MTLPPGGLDELPIPLYAEAMAWAELRRERRDSISPATARDIWAAMNDAAEAYWTPVVNALMQWRFKVQFFTKATEVSEEPHPSTIPTLREMPEGFDPEYGVPFDNLHPLVGTSYLPRKVPVNAPSNPDQ